MSLLVYSGHSARDVVISNMLEKLKLWLHTLAAATKVLDSHPAMLLCIPPPANADTDDQVQIETDYDGRAAGKPFYAQAGPASS